MALLKITSPHNHGPMTTTSLMRLVILATFPGIIAMTWFFGWGTVVNILWASISALAFESIALSLRKRPIAFYLNDYSALVTAFLLGIALPPYAPWWLITIGVGFAILLAKHLYGGMGFNPFNPAMVGYVVLLISFPLEMTTWGAPIGSFEEGNIISNAPGFLAALQACFMGIESIDAVTMATPLDLLKQNTSLPINEVWQANSQFGRWAGLGWEWINLGFLAGGLFLLYRRVFTWHAPISMLVTLTVMAAVFYDNGSADSGGSPLFHLLSGATMLGAFFIVTDPVTSAVSVKGRMIYGALIGVLLYLIRVLGNYPDAIAFAVLLMNFAAPLIDYYTQPKTYGYNKSKGGS